LNSISLKFLGILRYLRGGWRSFGAKRERMERLSDSSVGVGYVERARSAAWHIAWRTTRRSWLLFTGLTSVSIGIYWIVKGEFKTSELILFVAHCLTFILLELFKPKDSQHRDQFFLAWLLWQVLLLTAHFFAMRWSLFEGGIVSVMVAGSLVISAAIGSMTLPGPQLYGVIHTATSSLGTVFAARGMDVAPAFSLLVAASSLSGMIWRNIFLHVVSSAARSSLATRVMMAPAVAAGEALEDTKIDETFELKMRSTAFLVLSWQHIQDFSLDLRAAEFDEILQRAYGSIDRLLISHFNEGAWFADNFQSTIMIYLFFDEGTNSPGGAESHSSSLSRVVSFMAQMSEESRKIQGIDAFGSLLIGVSWGEMFTGMLGGVNFKKTAGTGVAIQKAIRAQLLALECVKTEQRDIPAILVCDLEVSQFLKTLERSKKRFLSIESTLIERADHNQFNIYQVLGDD
jgi:hypothetical protein